MATFSSRFPPRGEIWLTLLSIVFVINIWSILNILRAIPSWILSMNIWEMIGVISYPLTFALIESLLFLGGLILLAVILPGNFFRTRFVSQGSLAGLLTTISMIIAHLFGTDFGVWSVRGFGKWLLVLIAAIILSWVLVYFFGKLNDGIKSLVKWLSPLSIAYLAFDILAVFVVVIRNL